jgi:hypothetical protein
MAIRTDFTAGEVLAAADLNDTFLAKLNVAGGKILQIVRATDATSRTTTSTSYVDVTGMSVTITPQKSTSAVMLFAVGLARLTGSSGTDQTGNIRLTDSSDNAISGVQSMEFGAASISYSAPGYLFAHPFVLIGYVTPATTSPVTYKMRFLTGAATNTVAVRNDLSTGQMYAIEVSA